MNVLVLPGDDIGPEITAVALGVLERANAVYSLGLGFVTREIGVASFQRVGTTLPDAIVEEALAAAAVVRGACGSTESAPRARGGINPPACRLLPRPALRDARTRRTTPSARGHAAARRDRRGSARRGRGRPRAVWSDRVRPA